MDVPIAKNHAASLEHHLIQADAWLTASAQGEYTTALSYAALELRFAIERIAAHYWLALLGRPAVAKDFDEIRSFKRIERRIYALAGQQDKINRHYEFVRILCTALSIGIPLCTLDVGRLSHAWHDCSELCHIAWPLVSSTAGVGAQAYKQLLDIHIMLQGLVHGMGWPSVAEGQFGDLRDRYVAGSASADDVRSHIHAIGQLELPAF